jgi:hypothetical protein
MVKLQYVIPPVNFPKQAPPSTGGSQNASQQANNNGDASNKDGMWKDSVSSKDDHTTSVENIGNEKMPTNLNSLGVWGQGTTRADAEWHAAQIGDINYQSSGDWGSAYAVGSTDFLKLEGRVYGDSGYKDGTVMASGGVQGRFELMGSHYQAGYTSPTAFTFGGHDFNSRTTVNADASVGATATVNGGIALGKNDYVDVGASGFAGASASLKGSESIGDVATVKGDATVWAGVGAKANIDAGYKDGELSFSLGFGFAFGYGFDYDLGFSINVGAVGDCIEEGASDVVNGIGDAASAVGDGIGDAASAVGDAISSLF